LSTALTVESDTSARCATSLIVGRVSDTPDIQNVSTGLRQERTGRKRLFVESFR
jgi:hypothetical protein